MLPPTVRLEDEMWEALKEVAEREGCRLNFLASRIYRRKKSDDNFSSALRVFLMLYYRAAATEAGHAKAGHARRRGKRLTKRRPSRRSGCGPDDEIYGARRCIETGNPDEWS
jgi:predicted DNA-binding ribbon-helix-helix protein